MTRQELIAHMLEELGEGWANAERFYPVVKNGWIVVWEPASGEFRAQFETPVGTMTQKSGIELTGPPEFGEQQAIEAIRNVARRFTESSSGPCVKAGGPTSGSGCGCPECVEFALAYLCKGLGVS